MSMDSTERRLEVRALTGESITVSISVGKTVRDLKHLLEQTFPLAVKYPNFNLYHKLSLQNQISSYSIEPGEVIGLFPVIKKQTVQTEKSCDQDNSGNFTNQAPITKFADLAWTHMVQELREMSSNDGGPTSKSDGTNSNDGWGSTNEVSGTRSSEMKRKRSTDSETSRTPDDLVLSILEHSSKRVLDEGNAERFVKVLDRVNCLQDASSQSCLCVSGAWLQAGGLGASGSAGNPCWCPSWLKTVMKVLTFLNIYAACLQLRQEMITLNGLEEALNWIGEVGIHFNMKDIENISLLLPKVIYFVDYNAKKKRKYGEAIVIVRLSPEDKDRVEETPTIAEKQVSLPKLFYAMERRETAFTMTLRSLTRKLASDMSKFNLVEDVVNFLRERDNPAKNVKESDPAGSKSEVKLLGRRRDTSASNSRNKVNKLCHETNALLPEEMVEHLRKGIGSRGQMVHVQEIGGRRPNYMEIPNELSDYTKQTLEQIGVTELYSHQAESIRTSLAQKNVAVATMTSSGKSLCYNVPVFEELFKDSSSCALYMFPTKALSQDQLRTLKYMTNNFDVSSCIGIYDGDTLQEERAWLRDNARLLITNPDMLHKSILPYHGKFMRILSNLRFVVIDESHSYKGAFGCHTALILRRLRRLCSHVYGSDPKFIFSTATSANPLQHSMELANLSTLELIQNDGSPASQKLFVLWNSSLQPKTVLDRREREADACKLTDRGPSPIWEVSCLFAEMVQHGLRCIAFCTSRKLCELVLLYTQEILHETAPHLVDSITSYRAGYAPEIRRTVESDFFGGKLRGLAATNALELGIDVGHLDVTLHLGFPGSIASLWQQAGRSGRREKPSLAVYVAFDGALDQYFMKYPEKLFRSPIECCNIDSQNPQVLEQHLVCAALEHPLSLHHDEKFFGSGISRAVEALRNRGYLSFDRSLDSSARIWNYIGHEKKPSDIVNIRAIETEAYQVIDTQTNEILEKIEESKAFFQVHEGAVYMRQGKTYLVKDLDLSRKIAWCQEADLKYYTKTRDYTDVQVIGGDMAYPAAMPRIPQTNAEGHMVPESTAQANTCKVVTTWFGFRRISRGSNQVLDTVELSLPRYSYESQAVWIQVPQACKEAVERRNFSFRAGLHAASHALLNVVPLCIICNSSDLAPECSNPYDTRSFSSRILIYDRHPGGTGVSLQVRPYFVELLVAALEVISSCACLGDMGCPKCIQCLACHESNEDLHKDAAIIIIKGVLDAEKSHCRDIENFMHARESQAESRNQAVV
ncbi:uncharacterized protein LOC116192305 isoform X2 [Punica granatum]|uniref:Uncharacterized protein LOC116192305 isoform X2 n=1 Tax=Punica granatum TaxID=22663 RepID=A0A6P8C4M3_PUNGR|nr:uncharacterized protein LOC116192305 isoform X2 [Punica granatum]